MGSIGTLFLFQEVKEQDLAGFSKKTLPELFYRVPMDFIPSCTLPEVVVNGVTSDSREVNPGDIFVAIPGMTTDGHNFIPQAISRSAAAIVGSQSVKGLQVPYIKVSDPRQALAYLSAVFYGNPANSMIMIGVTGTDGKTTTANLIHQILTCAGIPCGLVSTVNAVIGEEVYDTGFHVTTPQAPEIQQFLAKMKDAGLTHAILEATSHGLAQHRVTGCEFDIGVLTNITHEHLNDHGSYEAYRDAKVSLFRNLSTGSPKANNIGRLAVLNKDDPSFDYINQQISVRNVAYSIHNQADIWAEEIHHESDGLHFTAASSKFRLPIIFQIPGIFNVSNCLAAIATTVIGLDIDLIHAREGIANLKGVPGRMEPIVMGQTFHAIVDFAHTPNALKQALSSVRDIVPGKVIAVFGSAGLRDREKRRMMAEVSAELADFTLLTAEDPRTESLDGILDDMRKGMVSRGGVEGMTFLCIPDRGEAIRRAVNMAGSDDLVIACGKGHEQSMCFGDIEYSWDDRTAMRAALSELMGVAGPQMPYLPTQDEHD